jgi:hypothetical protein
LAKKIILMVKCICVDDTKKPIQIPDNKWIKKGEEYHVVFTITVLPQKKLGVELYEITLDESCKPFEYFLANRFAFTREDLEKLNKLIKDCSEINFSIDELMKETELVSQ